MLPRRRRIRRARISRLRRRIGGRAARRSAERRLQRFRQATMLAIALTAFLMLLVGGDSVAAVEPAAPQPQQAESPAPEPQEAEDVLPAAAEEARFAAARLWRDFLRILPKILVALGALLLAWMVGRMVRWMLRRSLAHWERAEAFAAIASIGIWVVAIAVAVSILTGDARTLAGSLGLIGLALSWALQTPIESFAGWLMNSFRGYYRIGDRIAVGEVFGDVYRIDFLNTTLWEIGTPAREGFVKAEQPTGRLITFPNSEVLAGSITNLTRDFPWVWDELDVKIANESDLAYAMQVLGEVAAREIGAEMTGPAMEYERILREAGLERSVPQGPQIFVGADESSTVLTVRYLVGARERRAWKSRLLSAVTTELADARHQGKILPVYPRRQLQWIDPAGAPREPA